MTITVRNFYADCSAPLSEERAQTLWDNRSVRIERVVSHSHASPPGFWYDQAEDEWVMVVSGNASLEFEGGESVDLNAGDYLIIPRHVKHRVARTGEETVWLAVHVK